MTAPADAAIPSWTATRIFYPAGRYDHAAAGILQLRLIRRGSSYADIDLGRGKKRVFTRPGDLLLSLPHLPTTFRIDDGRELTLVRIPTATAAQILADLGGTPEELLPLADRPFRDALVAELCRRLESGQDRGRLAEWSLGVVLGTLLETARTRAARSRPGLLSARRLKLVTVLIEARLEQPLPVDELARAAGLARRPFAAAFREAVGMPVHQYLLRQRGARALRLLRTTALPLAEVAQRCGFSHQAHMTRVLNRLEGKTPRQVRLTSRDLK